MKNKYPEKEENKANISLHKSLNAIYSHIISLTFIEEVIC